MQRDNTRALVSKISISILLVHLLINEFTYKSGAFSPPFGGYILLKRISTPKWIKNTHHNCGNQFWSGDLVVIFDCAKAEGGENFRPWAIYTSCIYVIPFNARFPFEETLQCFGLSPWTVLVRMRYCRIRIWYAILRWAGMRLTIVIEIVSKSRIFWGFLTQRHDYIGNGD